MDIVFIIEQPTEQQIYVWITFHMKPTSYKMSLVPQGECALLTASLW